jgi:hypothetical protein
LNVLGYTQNRAVSARWPKLCSAIPVRCSASQPAFDRVIRADDAQVERHRSVQTFRRADMDGNGQQEQQPYDGDGGW